MRYRRSWALICLLLFSLFPPLDFKRGGISMGGTRGRGSSASRTGTGLFGGGSKPSRTSSGANAYHRNLGGNQQRTQNVGHGFNSGGWNNGLGKQHKDEFKQMKL
uniref:FoP_duplication domain-containing protein n=1 Tax=Heterorhabditis bacteriophora TaxID=37862 RepID=A0A1I7X4D4_HETBA